MEITDEILLSELNNEIIIVFPNEYRNQIWSEQYGKIQSFLRTNLNGCTKLIVDLSNITWIDPLPLLSLSISIEELKEIVVHIILPSIGSNFKNSNKVLAFFWSEGFFEQFSKKDIHFFDDRTEEIIDFSKYSALAGEMQYKDCSIIKAQVVNLNEIIQLKQQTIDEWIKELVSKAQYSIKNKIESYKTDEIINRLQRLLSETATNVYEHAYSENEEKFIGIYVRFRNGLANTRVSDKDRITLKKLFIDEQKNSPLLNWWFIDSVFNFIEIFIIDSGCGLSENYYIANEKPKYPFRIAWEDAVIKGIRGKTNRQKKTQFGGLYSICKTLGQNYIYARDANEFIGHSLPLRTGLVPSEIIKTDIQIKGFSLIFRLTWDVASDNETNWEKIESDSSNLENNPYFQELCEPIDIYQRFYGKSLKKDLEKSSIFVIDDRFNFSRRLSDKIYSKDKSNLKFCFYLPGQFLQKNKILSNVNDFFNDIVCTSRTLIICDIVVYEANLFQLALENATFSKEFLDSFDSIILISQRFSILYLDKDGDTYFKNSNLGKDFLNTTAINFVPHLSLKHTIAWLKTHDSLLFWLIVWEKSNVSNLLYINGIIKWYREDVEYEMDGYLNFAQIITIVEVKKILENSLYRTLSLSNNSGIRFNNIDILTSQLASKMNSLFYNYQSDTNQGQFEILLGSVIVSGLAEFNARQINYLFQQIPIHFFLHQSLKNAETNEILNNTNLNTPHLFLWPKEWLKKNFPESYRDFRRVGRSHVIAPYGWKYYPIPRFRLFDKTKGVFVNDFSEIDKNDDWEFISAYVSSPSESYNDWQIAGKQILEIGHYHYENKHDMLKFDFPLAINDSFNEGGKLAVFLLSEFLIALGLDTSSITTNSHDVILSYQKEKTSITEDILDKSTQNFINSINIYIENVRDIEKDECALIAYPSHYNTEHIISIIKEFIDAKFHDRIFALIPINKDRNGSAYLISPLVLEAMRQKISDFKVNGKRTKVLLFDEATIDGKTRKELKHLLFHLGADDVKTLCILDRQRLPFSTTNPEKHKAYWRLDIPRLGSKDNCLLCKSLDIINSFKNTLIYSRDKNRINQWINAWESRFPYSKSPFHGLISKPLNKPISKKFALYIDKNTGDIQHCENIQLTNSVGLTIYSGEIHSMTARDDMALNVCKNIDVDSLSKIEILAVNLLLFGRDFSFLVISKMVELIFKEINSTKETSNETALGVLTILSQPVKIVESLFELCANKEKNDIEVLNLDLELLLSYISQSKESKFSNIPTLKRHFGSKYISSILSVYKNFHYELHNDFGRIHNTALKNILLLNQYTPICNEKISQTISSCEKLEDLLSLFPLWNTRDLFHKEKMLELNTEIQDLIVLLKKHFDNIVLCQMQNPAIVNYIESDLLNSELCPIQNAIKSLNEQLFELHNLLFTNIGIQQIDRFPLKEEVKTLIESYLLNGERYKICFADFEKKNDPEYERWISWDKQITKKISYIIDNVKHSCGYMDLEKNYYNIFDDNLTLVNMLVSVKYQENFLLLIFENYSEKSNDYISLKAGAKNKPEKQHIIDLGGRIYYTGNEINPNLYLVQTIVELPYQ